MIFAPIFFKFLQAIDMVRMVMSDDDVGNFKGGDFCNSPNQPLRQRGGTQGIHHDNPAFAHNEGRVGNKVFIGLTTQCTLALHTPH